MYPTVFDKTDLVFFQEEFRRLNKRHHRSAFSPRYVRSYTEITLTVECYQTWFVSYHLQTNSTPCRGNNLATSIANQRQASSFFIL